MKAPNSHNFEVLASARSVAKDFGEAFVVFVGGLASYSSVDVGAARNQARAFADKHGRSKVTIKRVRV